MDSCLERHAFEERMKELDVSKEEERDEADDLKSKQINVEESATTVVTTPEKKKETKGGFGGEWKPLAERMRPTDFEQMAVRKFTGIELRVIMNSSARILLFERFLSGILLLRSFCVGLQDVERQQLLM